jgi:hypothetical protein
MQYIRIDNDKWEDLGKVWYVLEYSNTPESTGVKLNLEDTVSKEVHTRVVARNQIAWLEEKDSRWLEAKKY